MSIASKTGCVPKRLNEWVQEVEVDSGQRDAFTSEMAETMESCEGEVRALKPANQILCIASAYFAQAPLAICRQTVDGQRELDRPFKR